MQLAKRNVPNAYAVVADFERRFQAAAARGLSEEEAAQSFGDPAAVAATWLADHLVTSTTTATSTGRKVVNVSSVLRATLRALLLTPLNFVLLLGPFLIFTVILIVGWTFATIVGGFSFLVLLLSTLAIPFMFFNFWAAGAVLFGALTLAGFALLVVLTLWIFTRFLFQIFIAYLRWNVDFVMERQSAL